MNNKNMKYDFLHTSTWLDDMGVYYKVRKFEHKV